ncbi:MAG TPA: nicotinamide riboside transporter PnuC [Puia sp.]|jgi:nicotinamide mononucleotide transporter|nr:nicotinamide riboside transporter PnuC [Puia sp.]
MQVNELWQLLKQQVAETDTLQWIATVTGIGEVLLARVNNILLYPAGIISTLLTMYILYKFGLYADSLLNGYYMVMSVYGWWYWMKKKDQPAVAISICSPRDWLIVAAIVGIGFSVLYILLANWTPSTVPVWDAWVSATAWAGMWLLARRKVENWILLNVSNIFAIPLLFYKQLPLFAVLTIILFIVAVFGYFDWRKKYKLQIA